MIFSVVIAGNPSDVSTTVDVVPLEVFPVAGDSVGEEVAASFPPHATSVVKADAKTNMLLNFLNIFIFLFPPVKYIQNHHDDIYVVLAQPPP